MSVYNILAVRVFSWQRHTIFYILGLHSMNRSALIEKTYSLSYQAIHIGLDPEVPILDPGPWMEAARRTEWWMLS